MTSTRRGFFKLIAGAAALAAVPAPSKPVPILWGDGIHDDAPAFLALLDGEPVEFADPSMAKDIGWRGGCFYIGRSLYFHRDVEVDWGRFA